MIETYASARERLDGRLRELAELASERNSPSSVRAAAALREQLDESRFNVVAFGAFERGKTTFVNALLGADVLPSAVVPLTSIVTAIRWGSDVRATIEHLDGRAEDEEVSDLPAFVTEPGNPGNRRGVARAIVTYPSPDLQDGVSLVDTPGVGSVYEHNTDSARAFLDESDAAIFLTSADPPISDSERAFLRDVREQAARLFFVLNKVDYLSPGDRDEAVRFTLDVIEEAIGRSAVMYPIGAALEPKTTFTVNFFEVPTILESLLPDVRRFLPRATARRMLERDMREQIPRWVDKHAGRLRWDLVQRIDRTLRVAATLDDRLEATIASLSAGIERSRRERSRTNVEAREREARLSSVRRRIDALRSALADAAGEVRVGPVERAG
jgi:hypothetical protein